jgi:hypothetical protein
MRNLLIVRIGLFQDQVIACISRKKKNTCNTRDWMHCQTLPDRYNKIVICSKQYKKKEIPMKTICIKMSLMALMFCIETAIYCGGNVSTTNSAPNVTPRFFPNTTIGPEHGTVTVVATAHSGSTTVSTSLSENSHGLGKVITTITTTRNGITTTNGENVTSPLYKTSSNK